MLRKWTVIVAVVATSVLGTALPGSATATSASTAVVSNVVDGDTIDVIGPNGPERIRFLNIDTPEMGTCLADQATAFTAARLPVGAPVSLQYDTERHDRYGRTLAYVTNSQGVAISEALAAEGLGLPLLIKPNKRFYGRVVRAAKHAKARGAGVFDARVGCTPAGELKSARERVSRARSTPVRTSQQYRKVLAHLAVAERIVSSASKRRYGLRGAWFGSYLSSSRAAVRSTLRQVRTSKKAERSRVVRSKSAPKPSSKPSGGSSGGSGAPSNYNGPRCYEPGGVRWHPC